MTTYAAALAAARAQLQAAGADTPGLDCRLLMAAATGLDQARLIAGSADAVPDDARALFDSYLSRRRGGEPVARILGRRDFWGMCFRLNAATLVPRPETETLVEAVLAQAGRFPDKLRICDLGTGSGAILIALLTEIERAEGTGTDIAAAALDMARANAERLGVGDRMRLVKADFAAGVAGPFEVIVSNPPYIAAGKIAELAVEVRDHDPLLALDGGRDGLSAYRTILDQAPGLLVEGGLLGLEVGHDQADDVARLCQYRGLQTICLHTDLSGTARVVTAVAGCRSPIGRD